MGNYSRPLHWDDITSAIVNSGISCYDPQTLNVPPCGLDSNYILEVFDGSCWTYHQANPMTGDPAYYEPCTTNPPGTLAKCTDYYYVCLEIINGQPHYRVWTDNSAPANPTFNCVGPGCETRCDQQ